MNNCTTEKLGPPNPLKGMIDDFFDCVVDALHKVKGHTPFCVIANGLAMELVGEVSARIVELQMAWMKELPLGDQRPLGVNWEEMSTRALSLRDELMRHPSYYQLEDGQTRIDTFTPGDLAEQLKLLSAQLLAMDEVLHPNDRPELYMGYGQNYLEKYELNHWAKRQREWRNELSEYVATHKKEFYVKQLNRCLDALSEHKPYIVSNDRKSIYKEALGVVLWRDHSYEQTQALDILAQVRSAKFFSELLDKPLVFLDREITEEEMEQHPELRKENKVQTVKQGNLPYIKIQCSWMKDYLNTGYTTHWVDRFWDDAMRGEQKLAFMKKLSTPKKRNKTVCQVLGELQECRVFKGEPIHIATIIKEGVDGKEETRSLRYKEQLPTRATLKDYARKGVDDVVEIHDWIVKYVGEHRVES